MSRKALFGDLAPTGGAAPVGEAPRPIRPRMRPILGDPGLAEGGSASPVGAVGRSLEAVGLRARRADEVEEMLASAQSVVEIDTGAVDASFIADRMPSDETHAELVESIRQSGQQVPILVRPHPDGGGRFQVAYGHRRLRAARELGRPVRAVVRQLGDEELAVAQGQENNERRDLSYIEKARFARGLEERFGRKTVMAALSLYKSDLSNMLSVVSCIPETMVDAIGPAPGVGRRGWIELADAIARKGAAAASQKALTAEGFPSLPSDERFKAVLAATRPKGASMKTKVLVDAERREIGRLASGATKVTVTVDRRKAPRFAEFVATRLQDLYKEFEAGPDRP